MIKAIVFDFDGVIVDSNRFKRDAWFEVFPPEEGVSAELIKRVWARIKQTRYDIIRAIFTELGRPTEEVERAVIHYAEVYNRVVQSGLAHIGFMPGTAEALEGLARTHRLYVNSATPEDALKQTCRNLGIDKYFEDIYGVPGTKEENLRKVMAREVITGEEVLMVGDGESDRDAAVSCQCFFAGIPNEWNEWKGTPFPLIESIAEVRRVIDEEVT